MTNSLTANRALPGLRGRAEQSAARSLLATVPSIPVIASPMFDPGCGRIEMTVPVNSTLEVIIKLVLPDLAASVFDRLRVSLVTDKAAWIIEPCNWRRVRPRPGATVVIRAIPAGDNAKPILTVVVAIAATIIAPYLAPALLGAIGVTASGFALVAATTLIGVGLTFLGNTLINSIFPTNAADANDPRNREKPTFAISGFKNEIRPGGALPVLFGRRRVAPYYAMPPFTEIVGDEQYINGLFIVGSGHHIIRDKKFGDTPTDRFDDIDIEIRQGLATDTRHTLITKQVLEERHGAELVRPWPRDSQGNIIDGSVTTEKPVTRFTAGDIAEAGVIIGFPTGLVEISGEGKNKVRQISIRIRQRLNGVGAWQTATNLVISAAKTEAVYRQHVWTLPSRGRYEIEITRMTDDGKDNSVQDRCVLVVIQSIRPEYPINFNTPICSIAVRAKATYQLNGAIDNFNVDASHVVPDWDSTNWVNRETSNCASAYRYVLQGPENAAALADSGINLPSVEEFHNFCVAKGLKYDRYHDFHQTLIETLAQIAAAGRAAPRYDGRKWGMVTDRSDKSIVQHINSQNANGIKWTRTYPKPPDALRVSFLDQTNNYAAAEMIIPWPDHVGPVKDIERLELPGKTDPHEIWVEARRRQHELNLRLDRYEAVIDGIDGVATRGDRVRAAFDRINRIDAVARVSAVDGRAVTLNSTIIMKKGKSYAINYKVPATNKALPDDSIVMPVKTLAGEHQNLLMQDIPTGLKAGSIVHFGEAGKESLDLVIAGIEAGQNGSSIVKMRAAAPEIDTLTDAEIPPAWDGRVGSVSSASTAPPAIPRIVSVAEAPVDGSDNVDIYVGAAPGYGSSVAVDTYTLFHRLEGATPWVQFGPVPAAGASFKITGYEAGENIEYELLATAANGFSSARSVIDTIAITLAEPVPDEPPNGMVTGDKGHAIVSYTTPGPDNFEVLAIYRSITTDIANAIVAAELSGLPANSSGTYIDGDALVVDLVSNGIFQSARIWAADANWTINANAAGGNAEHSTGVADNLCQALTLPVGKTIRALIVVSDMTAGSLDVELTGGTTTSLSTISANGDHLTSGVVVSGNDTLNLAASSDFDGKITRVVLFKPSTGSLAQDTYYYWIKARNGEGGESTALSLGEALVI